MITNYSIDIIRQNEHSLRFRLKNGAAHLTFGEVFQSWQTNEEFIVFYTNALIALEYQAFYWEHPALNEALLQKKYECILQRSKPLERLASNEEAFKDYLSSSETVADFMNLGKNARLVVPTKKRDKESYNHLGRFLRQAAQEQIIAVFNRVGSAILEELGTGKLIWLNTAGLGVIWLHIRMDTRPKYYKTQRYKAPDFLEA